MSYLCTDIKTGNMTRKTGIITSIASAVFIVACILLAFSARTTIREKTGNMLKEAILEDYEQRMSEIGSICPPEENPERMVKEGTITTAEGTQIIIFPESIPLKTADRLMDQHMMAIYKPLNPDKVNEIFKSKLKNAGIDAESGIVYRYNEKRTYSQNDSTACSHASYRTDEVAIDYPQTAFVQGWIDYNVFTLFSQVDPLFLSALIIAVILFFIAATKSDKKIKEKNISILPADTATETAPQPESNPTGISIDWINHTFTIRETSQPLPKKTLEVLNLFLQAPNHRLTCQEIYRTIWKDIVPEAGKNNAYTHISRLRKTFEHFEGYDIINTKNEGYQLVFP